jgi:hypothetical protein
MMFRARCAPWLFQSSRLARQLSAILGGFVQISAILANAQLRNAPKIHLVSRFLGRYEALFKGCTRNRLRLMREVRQVCTGTPEHYEQTVAARVWGPRVEGADARKTLLMVGIMTAHSLGEGSGVVGPTQHCTLNPKP